MHSDDRAWVRSCRFVTHGWRLRGYSASETESYWLAGLPLWAMRMAVVIDEQGQGHAVLIVLTDSGEFILDNKRNAVLPWRRTGDTFVKREGMNGSAGLLKELSRRLL